MQNLLELSHQLLWIQSLVKSRGCDQRYILGGLGFTGMPLHSDHWLDLFLFQHLPSPLAHPHPHTNTYMLFISLGATSYLQVFLTSTSLYQQGRGEKNLTLPFEAEAWWSWGGLCSFAHLPILEIRERFLIRLHRSLLIAQALSSCRLSGVILAQAHSHVFVCFTLF